MIALFSRSWRLLARRPLVRISLQAAVSLILIVLLVRAAQSGQNRLLDSLGLLQPQTIALVMLLQLVAVVLNSRRWQLLLRHLDVHETLGCLTRLYLVGQFFSLFLPTSSGGDAVRIYEVSRRTRQPAQTVVATLQERLLGLGTAMFLGVVATVYYFQVLPVNLRLWALGFQSAGVLGVLLLLYPGPLWSVACRCWQRGATVATLRRLADRPLVIRIVGALRPVLEAPPLRPWQLGRLFLLAVTAALLGISSYYAVGQALHMEASLLAFCLVVPLVWVVRMLPVSLNGIGVGEGASVYLLSLFAVPRGPALGHAIAMLGLQTGLALLGGLLLAGRLLRNGWGARGEETTASVDQLALAGAPETLGKRVVANGGPHGQATRPALTMVVRSPVLD